jgi:hypothetical protein
MPTRRAILFFCLTSALTSAARADVKWTAPSAEELKMTAEPKAPGAQAIILSYEEVDDANTAEVTLHVRIKILTEGGLSAATVELPEAVVMNDQFGSEVNARTIHRDGFIVLFQGGPQNRIDDKGNNKLVIAFPNAEVGSVLEYIVHYHSQETLISTLITYYAPVWHAQHQYFARSEHFSLRQPDVDEDNYVHWAGTLPAGVNPVRVKGTYTLDLKDVPAVPDEELMPPRASVAFLVRFFYYRGTTEKYWGESADRVDNVWSPYYQPRKAIKAAVASLVQPTDTDEVKLRKLYAAVTKLENTDFSRERTRQEDKRNHLRDAHNSDDIWAQQRGDSEELTLLFIALARAAGFTAYPMAVTSRDRPAFDQQILSWSQTDSMVAIVTLNGKEIFFDPGTRFCPFAQLSARHSDALGVSIEGKLVKFRSTPEESRNQAIIEHGADLHLSAEGRVTGVIKFGWSPAAAISLRQNALLTDETQARDSMENAAQAAVPKGVEVKLVSFGPLSDSEAPLFAAFTVSGKLGAVTSTRIVLPSQFFQTNATPVLASATRTLPIAFPERHAVREIAILRLPATFEVEAMPKPQAYALGKTDSAYSSSVTSKADPDDKGPNPAVELIATRLFALDRLNFAAVDAVGLSRYFGRIASNDAEQIVLHKKVPDSH